MSESERRLNHRRSLGVARAWRREKGLVCRGCGTREWVLREQKIMLENGRVKGYQGHHMKSVARYPEYADDPNNIQFLCSRPDNNEHLRAHGGDYRNETDGVYDVRTGIVRPLPPGRPRPLPSRELREKAIHKRGYTRYAEAGASGAPRRRKAQKQVTFEGRSYTRTMIKTGVQTPAKQTAVKAAAVQKARKSPAAKAPAVQTAGKSPVAKTSVVQIIKSGPVTKAPARASDRREVQVETVRGSVRQMMRARRKQGR